MSKSLVSALALSAVVLATSTAVAEPTKKTVEVTESDDGYGYDFFADDISAENMGINAAVIKVRQGPVRRTLIRPRTNFVPELYKSIEQI